MPTMYTIHYTVYDVQCTLTAYLQHSQTLYLVRNYILLEFRILGMICVRNKGSRPTTMEKRHFFLYIYIYFSPKIVEKNLFCQNPFPAILGRKKQTKKSSTTKPRPGGKGLCCRTTKQKFFFAASLRASYPT